MRDGLDPIVDRQKARRVVKRLTLKEAIDGCFEARKAELKREGRRPLDVAAEDAHHPEVGSRAVEEIDQHVLIEVLRPLWHEKTEVARKALNRINLTLKHAAALGLDVDLQATMKARALLGKQRHEAEHIPSLPYTEAPAFYQWLTTVSGVRSTRAALSNADVSPDKRSALCHL